MRIKKEKQKKTSNTFDIFYVVNVSTILKLNEIKYMGHLYIVTYFYKIKNNFNFFF